MDKHYPSRVDCTFMGKKGKVILDQLRTVDKTRLIKKMGFLSIACQGEILKLLEEMFSK